MLEPIHNLLHQFFDPLEKALNLLGLGFPELLTIMFIVGVLITIPWVNIYVRAGYSPLKGYLMFIPVVNVVMFFRFAFGEWPIERELRLASPSILSRERI